MVSLMDFLTPLYICTVLKKICIHIMSGANSSVRQSVETTFALARSD